MAYYSSTVHKKLNVRVHLPVNAAAKCPVSIYKEVDSCKQQHHGHWVIEQTEHKDGMDPIRSTTHKEEHIGRNLDELNKYCYEKCRERKSH